MQRVCGCADEGSWVRVRTAVYKGDLAKVVDADYAAGKATVKIVPRLDYAAMAARAEAGRQPGQPFGRQAGAMRPPARWRPAAAAGSCTVLRRLHAEMAVMMMECWAAALCHVVPGLACCDGRKRHEMLGTQVSQDVG